jgi:Outer membrane protein beta-barrel domain
MRNWLLTLAVTFAVHAGLTSPAVAQTPPQSTRAPLFEISVGYQSLNVTDGSNTSFPFGLAADMAFNAGAIGFVAEAGWSRRSEGDEPDEVLFNFWHTGGGIRWSSRRSPRVWLYGQALVGATFHEASGEIAGFDQSDITAHVMVQPGGGVNVVVGNGLGVVGAVDYRRVFLNEQEEGDSGLNEVRLFVGVRLSLR